jgi:hypothetical protein
LTNVFIGTGRYVPGDTTSMDIAGQRTNYDPFTGAGRYVPDANSSSSSLAKKGTNGNHDPFTSSGRYIPNGDNEQPSRPLSASQSSVISMKYIFSLNSI